MHCKERWHNFPKTEKVTVIVAPACHRKCLIVRSISQALHGTHHLRLWLLHDVRFSDCPLLWFVQGLAHDSNLYAAAQI